jgi:alpha-glucosidase
MLRESEAPWWRGAVIYQVYPLSFADGNGDGYGDLPGLEARLDYIAALGADAIWLAPFFRSPMLDWGYDVSCYTEVDPIFGTLQDADRVINKAHALGLKVLVDQVWSHSSSRHPWFEESRASRSGPRSDWYIWADAAPDGTPPNNWLSVFGGVAWTWEPRRRQYYLHHFLSTQPKLNLRNPEVLAAILGSGEFWLARGADGFRIDAVDFMLHDPALSDNPAVPAGNGATPLKPFAFQDHRHDMLQAGVVDVMRQIRALTDRYPGTLTLAEVSSQGGAFSRIADYTSADGLHLGYTLGLLRGELSAELFANALAEGARAVADFSLCWALGNHDVARLASRWGGTGPDRAARGRLLMTLAGALPGTMCLYQGDELGLPEAELAVEELRDPFGIAYWPMFPGRDGGRTPMPWHSGRKHAGFTAASRPWLPVPDAHIGRAVDLQLRDPKSPLSEWRAFLAWRRGCLPLLHGKIANIRQKAGVLAFERVLGGDRMLCIFNISSDAAQYRLPEELTAAILPAPGAHGLLRENDVILAAWDYLIVRLSSDSMRGSHGEEPVPAAIVQAVAEDARSPY